MHKPCFRLQSTEYKMTTKQALVPTHSHVNAAAVHDSALLASSGWHFHRTLHKQRECMTHTGTSASFQAGCTGNNTAGTHHFRVVGLSRNEGGVISRPWGVEGVGHVTNQGSWVASVTYCEGRSRTAGVGVQLATPSPE